MSQQHDQPADERTDGERIEIGPDDQLQESAQDWLVGGGLALGAAKVGVEYLRVKLDRDRLELDRERLDFDREQSQTKRRAADD